MSFSASIGFKPADEFAKATAEAFSVSPPLDALAEDVRSRLDAGIAFAKAIAKEIEGDGDGKFAASISGHVHRPDDANSFLTVNVSTGKPQDAVCPDAPPAE